MKVTVVEAAQGDDALGVEREQADGVGEHEHAVRHALAEAPLRRPLGVGVLGVPVAGQRRNETRSASVIVRARLVKAAPTSGRRCNGAQVRHTSSFLASISIP